MKVVVWDIETSFIHTKGFSLYPKSIPHTAITRDWFIHCIAFKELERNPVYCVNTLHNSNTDHTNDYHICKVVRDYLSDADVLIAHNGDRFDLKKFNSRLIYHEIEPLPPIASVDTLKAIRGIAKFTSHRLDYLCKHLGYDGKYNTPRGLWDRCDIGDIEAIKEMSVYCKEDVRQLEKFYLRTRKYYKSHPNLADSGTMNCPKCNGNSYSIHKHRLMASGLRKPQYQCSSCGSYFTERKILKDKPNSKV